MWFLLLFLLCPLGMYLMMRSMATQHGDHQQPDVPTALEILQRRYAQGEITQDEFERTREMLTQGPGARVA